MYEKYKNTDDDVLHSANRETSWLDWKTKMSANAYFGDELCVEAVMELYNVGAMIVSGANPAGQERISSKGNPERKQIWLGCALDVHFYSLVLEAVFILLCFPFLIKFYSHLL